MEHHLAVVVAGLGASSALAQPFEIPRSVVAGGGGTSTGAVFSVTGTVGQNATGRAESATFSIDGGFWSAPAPPPDCPADVNGDGLASPADFTAWLTCFSSPGSQPFCDRADVNADGSIGPADFTAWLAAFNVGCG